MLAEHLCRLFNLPVPSGEPSKRSGSKRTSIAGGNAAYSVLEPRQMLAATIVFDIDTGIVTVNGTTGADIVSVTEDGSDAVVAVTGGETQRFDLESLFSIYFYGGAGDDVFLNSSYADTFLFGHAGADTLHGGLGFDYIQAGPGDDYISGGYGNDQLFGHDGNDIIFAGPDHDRVLGGNGNDEIHGGDGDDYLGGDFGDDVIYGDDGDDTLLGYSGNDTLWGGNGDDLTYGQAGADYQNGEGGADVVRGGLAIDQLYGGDGDDYMQGDQDNDLMYGEGGNDVLIGFTGDDFLDGGDGDDLLYGQQDNDEVHGGAGLNVVRGGTGDDLLYGGDQYDFIKGDSGNDVIFAGGGNDRIIGDAGDDVIHGGDGNDIISGNDGDDFIRGDAGNDVISGGEGADSIFGGTDANDTLTGDGGGDRFLVRPTDTVTDQTGEDARLVFLNDTSNWNDAEVEVFDLGFAQLASRTNNTRLLQDSVPSGDLTFHKVNDLGGSAGVNYLSITTTTYPDGSQTFEYEREIHIADWDETSTFYNNFYQSVAIHELAHNWDSQMELELASSALIGKWDEFINLSGWTDTDPGAGFTQSGDGQWWYANNASFAESYGMTNPSEDMATIWEFYFSGDTTSDPGLQSKLDVLDSIFSALAS